MNVTFSVNLLQRFAMFDQLSDVRLDIVDVHFETLEVGVLA